MSVSSGVNPTDQLSSALRASGILNDDEGEYDQAEEVRRRHQRQLEQLTKSLSTLTPVPMAQLMATGGEVAGLRELLMANLARTSAEAAREMLMEQHAQQTLVDSAVQALHGHLEQTRSWPIAAVRNNEQCHTRPKIIMQSF